jgi:hypothetical protein
MYPEMEDTTAGQRNPAKYNAIVLLKEGFFPYDLSQCNRNPASKIPMEDEPAADAYAPQMKKNPNRSAWQIMHNVF